jgi:hypothetical protein
MPPKNKSAPTFAVRFVAPGLTPEKVPLRAVSDALAAVQDLASGRDPFETAHVPAEKSIGLIDVRRGSAEYCCVSRAPQEAIDNLRRVGVLLAPDEQAAAEDDGDSLVAALRPIESLSEVARSVGCRLEVVLMNKEQPPLLVIGGDDFQRIAGRLMMRGDTTVIGTVERVGGATGMRCLMRVPGRHRILYCDVESRPLVRRLGEHLYEQIAAIGTAMWIHRAWRIYKFTIRDFTQPQLGDANDAIKRLRGAGLSAWDKVDDPEAFLQELR